MLQTFEVWIKYVPDVQRQFAKVQSENILAKATRAYKLLFGPGFDPSLTHFVFGMDSKYTGSTWIIAEGSGEHKRNAWTTTLHRVFSSFCQKKVPKYIEKWESLCCFCPWCFHENSGNNTWVTWTLPVFYLDLSIDEWLIQFTNHTNPSNGLWISLKEMLMRVPREKLHHRNLSVIKCHRCEFSWNNWITKKIKINPSDNARSHRYV